MPSDAEEIDEADPTLTARGWGALLTRKALLGEENTSVALPMLTLALR